MKLVQFENLKAWHQRHWREQPVEKHVWDIVLTFWLAGWVGFPSAFLLHARWAAAACVALFFLPGSLRRAAPPPAPRRHPALRLDRGAQLVSGAQPGAGAA